MFFLRKCTTEHDRALRSAFCNGKLRVMPFLSDAKHCGLYTSSPTLVQELEDIGVVIETLRQLPIATRLKKGMLDAALWQVVFATGNTQKKFMGPYRGETVITRPGLKIQRDHAYRRVTLLSELFGPSPDLDSIIDRAQCCCIVTEDEHRRLTAIDIDGWDRYTAANIVMYDMRHGRRVDVSKETEPATLFSAG